MKRARREETEEEEETEEVRGGAFITARDQYVSCYTLCVWCTEVCRARYMRMFMNHNGLIAVTVMMASWFCS